MDNISIDSTWITTNMANKIPKEDYKYVLLSNLVIRYYFIDPKFRIPPKSSSPMHPLHICNFYHPSEEVKFFGYGTKNEERQIFHCEEEYNEFENQKLAEINEYIDEEGVELGKFY
jgi:hypothetical protein